MPRCGSAALRRPNPRRPRPAAAPSRTTSRTATCSSGRPGPIPFVDTEEDRLSTFALDVDTGVLHRRPPLPAGRQPAAAEAIRVEEFVNAFDYGDPRRRRRRLRASSPTARPRRSPAAATACSASRSRRARSTPEDRKPAVLTFVVDVSGSMDAREPARPGQARARPAARRAAPEGPRRPRGLRHRRPRRCSSHTPRPRAAIRDAIDRLARRRLDQRRGRAAPRLRPGRRGASGRTAINRVILCSDGVANVGATGPEAILRADRPRGAHAASS